MNWISPKFYIHNISQWKPIKIGYICNESSLTQSFDLSKVNHYSSSVNFIIIYCRKMKNDKVKLLGSVTGPKNMQLIFYVYFRYPNKTINCWVTIWNKHRTYLPPFIRESSDHVVCELTMRYKNCDLVLKWHIFFVFILRENIFFLRYFRSEEAWERPKIQFFCLRGGERGDLIERYCN